MEKKSFGLFSVQILGIAIMSEKMEVVNDTVDAWSTGIGKEE